MGASSRLWQIENDKLFEQFQDGEIEEDEFRSTMRSRGFDSQEIDDHVDVLEA